MDEFKEKKDPFDATTSKRLNQNNNKMSSLYQKKTWNAHDYDLVEENKNSWERPISLNDQELVPFPKGVFPKWLNDFIQAVSIETQNPIDAPAFATLSTVSSVLNKKFDIHVRGSWKEYLNLYLTLALDSGNRKSAVFSQVTKPLYDYQEEKRIELTPVVMIENERISAKEKRLTKLKNNFAKAADNKILEAIDLLSKEIHKDKRNQTVIPKLTASDATPEKLALIMAEHNEKIALLSSEGGEVFEMIAGRYGDKPNQDIYLKSFSSESFDVERISREPLHLTDPSMVIGLFVQPSVIQNIPDEFTNRGLTQRFLYSFPKSFLGYRNVEPETVPETVEAEYAANIERFLNLSDSETKTLNLSDEALTYLVEEQKWVEKEMQDKNLGTGMTGWLSKLVGSIIRISGILHVIENVERVDSLDKEIKEDTLRRAFFLRDYLISHAEKGFGIMGVDEKEEDLEYLLEMIKERCRKDEAREITYRDVYESVKGRFKTAAVYREKLTELEEVYWIRQYKDGKNFISLNPHIPLN